MIELNEDRIKKGTLDDEDDNEEDEKEVLLSISKILETLIAPTEYLIKIK
jgi:hypothetical protein